MQRQEAPEKRTKNDREPCRAELVTKPLQTYQKGFQVSSVKFYVVV